jgi:hypothetical protein
MLWPIGPGGGQCKVLNVLPDDKITKFEVTWSNQGIMWAKITTKNQKTLERGVLNLSRQLR